MDIIHGGSPRIGSDRREPIVKAARRRVLVVTLFIYVGFLFFFFTIYFFSAFFIRNSLLCVVFGLLLLPLSFLFRLFTLN